MLRRILLGLNGSEFSQAATNLALELAAQHNTSVLGLGVVDEPHLTAPEPIPLGAGPFKQERDAAVLQNAHEKIDELLAAFSERCRAANVSWQAEKQVGNPVAILSEQAQRCDLLVVGKRHVATPEGERATSTLDQLLRHSPRPVVCVPAVNMNGDSVLVAYDGSLQAARTLYEFITCGLGANRQLYVASLGDRAQQHAELATDFLTAHAQSPRVIIEPAIAQPAGRLLEIAQQHKVGMIVLGCYGQPFLKEFLFGSVTKAVLAATHFPLFLCH